MDPNRSVFERAFDLAASGRFLTVSEIRLRLHREGYREELIQGPILAKQLLDAIEQARADRATSKANFGSTTMAVNKPTGDNARKGAVKKRSQLKTKVMGEENWTKRNKGTREFMDQKKAPAKKPFKGVRKEKSARNKTKR